MRKYLTLLSVSFSQSATYRMRMFLWAVVDVLYIFVFPFLWLAIYGERDVLNGFSKQDIVTYYILVAFLNSIVRFYMDYMLNECIRDGFINTLLVRPINVFFYKYIEVAPYQFLKLVFFAAFLALGFHWISDYLILPISALHIGMIALVVVFANVLRSAFDFIIGMTSFWLEEGSGITATERAVTTLMSGELAPLAFFPLWFQGLNEWLPFKYMVSFPVEVYLGKVSGVAFIQGIGVMALWVLVLAVVAVVVWKLGIRTYSALGDGMRV